MVSRIIAGRIRPHSNRQFAPFFLLFLFHNTAYFLDLDANLDWLRGIGSSVLKPRDGLDQIVDCNSYTITVLIVSDIGRKKNRRTRFRSFPRFRRLFAE